MRNEIFNFEADKPAIISLKYRTGKEFNRNGRRGFTYTLTNGLVTFFPPDVDREIQALHVDAGQPIRITRKASGEWEVERAEVLAGGAEIGGNPARPVSSAPVDIHASQNGRAVEHCPNHTTNGSAPPMPPAWGMSILRQALFAVIDDAYEAETYAAGKGLAIRFSGEDIRCMANTAVINAAQGGR